MKTVVTLTRVYRKVVKYQVEPDLLKGMNPQEIGEYLMNLHLGETENELFEKTDYEEISFNPSDLETTDTDRFDIYTDDGDRTYGGHL